MTDFALADHPVAAPNVRIWRSTLAYGALWGCAVMGMETVLQPVEAITSRYATFVLYIGLHLLVEGICIAALAIAAERYLRWRWLPLLLVVMALVAGVAVTVCERLFQSLTGLTVFPNSEDVLSAFSYHAWIALFYGGLLLLGRVFSLHAERVTRLLSRAELERSRREATLGELRLEWLQGSFDPRLMRDVLTDIQLRQGRDPAGAERLLDELVGFLRLAMPSLRHTASTLAAEVALVQAYAKMQRERYGGQDTWRVSADDVADMAFPPLLLFSLLDVFAMEGQPSRGRLSVQRTQAAVCIEMSGESGAQARVDSLAILTHRLEVGLRALHEERFQIRHDAHAGSLQVLVRLPGPAPFPSLPATNLEISR